MILKPMKKSFQIYNYQKLSDSELNLYGKDFLNADAEIKSLVITNIVSDVYFKVLEKPGFVSKDELKCNDCISLSEKELRKEISLYFGGNLIKIEKGKRKNIFHNLHEKTLNLLKVSVKKKKKTTDFQSEYCDFIFTEFSNPIEQFVICKKLMGCSVISFNEEKTVKKKNKVFVDLKHVAFEKAEKFKKLKIATLVTDYENGELIRYVVYDGFKKCFIEGRLVEDLKNDENIAKIHKTTKTFAKSLELLEDLTNTLKNPFFEMLLTHNFNSKRIYNNLKFISCDLFTFAQATTKGRDFSIGEIAETFSIDYHEGNLLEDAKIIFTLHEKMNVINLAREMSEISGFPFSKCLTNSRAERIEYLMLHSLYERNFLFPPVCNFEQKTYAGGLVLEPKRGYFEEIVLLLDFNSLYPSIIQEWNVCFSTIEQLQKAEENKTEIKVDEEFLFLPRILQSLVKRRNDVKSLMRNAKTPSEMLKFDTRQKVLKLTANSIYGCLGFSASRMCNFDMASFITQKGRMILEDTKKMAEEKMSLSVIYGDTDSLMIHTKFPGTREFYTKAKESIIEFQKLINSKYKHIYLEFESAFAKLVIYTKKKYAGLVFDLDTHKQETKGLEIVRRDYARVGTELCQKVLDLLLNPLHLNDKLNHTDKDMYSANKKMEEDKMIKQIYEICVLYNQHIENKPVSDFVISIVLSKDLTSYDESANLPHVKLGLRLKREKKAVYVPNDVINYVMGMHIDKTNVKTDSGKRDVFHPKEAFTIDYMWYIKNQVLPPLYRLLALIKNVQVEKIGLIFNVTDVSIPDESRVELTIFSTCCEYAIELDTLQCGKCKKMVDVQYIKHRIFGMLYDFFHGNSGISYENTENIKIDNATMMNTAICPECKRKYTNSRVTCFYCKKELIFTFRNKEFDDLLCNIEKTLSKNPKLNEINVSYFSAHSGYRKIDLFGIFKEEVERYNL